MVLLLALVLRKARPGLFAARRNYRSVAKKRPSIVLFRLRPRFILEIGPLRPSAIG
jgi:hypothetical protein